MRRSASTPERAPTRRRPTLAGLVKPQVGQNLSVPTAPGGGPDGSPPDPVAPSRHWINRDPPWSSRPIVGVAYPTSRVMSTTRQPLAFSRSAVASAPY